MRILYYHQHFSTPSGSTGTRAYEMAQRLIANGHSVTVICGSYAMATTGLNGPYRRGRRSGTVDGINIIELELPYANKDRFILRTWTFLRFALRSSLLAVFGRYDILFATSTPLTVAIPGIAARVFRRKPFIFEVRDLWPELPKAMGVITNPFVLTLISWLEWIAYRSATSCIGLSPGIVEGIKRRAGPGKRVVLNPNGSDLEMFSGSAGKDRSLPGDNQRQLVCVFMGAHGLSNGLDAVLNAAAELKTRGRKDIRLVLIGGGKCKPALQQRVEDEELEIVTMLDPIAKTELDAALSKADVGLMILANVPAFYFGTSPNKFFDFIAAGLPVLNNYPGWLANMITEEKIGLTVQPESAPDFADALEYLADHDEERLAMGRRARKLAEDKFDRDKLGEAFIAEFERLAC
jgi:glycosyltransferase involved in cell wall biosynthesis